MKLNKVIAGTSAVALSLAVAGAGSVFADTINGTNNGSGDMEASHALNLEVEVQDTLSLDCYDITASSGDHTVTLGTAGAPGIVTAGTPAVGGSTCDVTTNDDQGYYLTMENSTSGTNGATDVLQHTDVNAPGTTYQITEVGLTEWDWTEGAGGSASATVDWDATDPTGLGFSVMNVPEVDATHNSLNDEWGTAVSGGACVEGIGADDNVYAGIPDSPEAISAVVSYSATETSTDVCYKVDVTAVQQSGDYAGQVTFTATTDASTYYN